MRVVYCEKCGLRLPDWAHYCERCGTPLATADASAGAPGVMRSKSAAERPSDSSSDQATAVLRLDEVEEAQGKAADADLTQPMGAAVSADRNDLRDEDLEDEAFEDDFGDEDDLDDADELDDDDFEDEDYDEIEDGAEEPASPASKTGEYAAAHYYDDEIEDEWSRRYSGNPWQQEGAIGYVGAVSGDWLQTISEGESSDVDPAIRYYHNNVKQRQQISKWRRGESQGAGVSSLAAYGIAAAAVVFGIILVSVILAQTRNLGSLAELTGSAPVAITQEEADRIIKGLDGWWKTNRKFDGRYWHIEGSKLKTYGADGVLAEEELINDKSVERMSKAPADIGGGGYYLRSVALFLRNDDPDTLYAIQQDGKAAEDANLHRTEKPDLEFTDKRKEKPEDTRGDFILPDSDKRYYETSELENLSDHDLYLARNELFARHGYIFLEGGELAERFGAMSWYTPNESFDRSMFNEFERRNVNTIYALEQSRSSAYL